MDDPNITRFHKGLPKEFFLANGYLNHSYAALEVNLRLAVENLVTIDAEDPTINITVPAILGSMRMDVLTATTKRLLRVLNFSPEIQEFFQKYCGQITELQYFRNRLIHHETLYHKSDYGDFYNIDDASAKEEAKVLGLWFDINVMKAAIDDLDMAIDVLLTWDALLFNYADNQKLELPAWRYKPSMLTRHNPSADHTVPVRRFPPQSSEG